MDHFSGLTVNAAASISSTVLVQAVPNLSAQINGPLTNAIAAGSNITFTVTVSNTGAGVATAIGVSVNAAR